MKADNALYLQFSEAASLEQSRQRLTGTASDREFYDAWLDVQCSAIPDVLSAALVLGAPDTGPFAPQAFWPQGRSEAPRLTELAERALQERHPVVADLPPVDIAGATRALSQGMAIPIEFHGHLQGVAVLEMTERPDHELQSAIRQLQWGVAWIENRLQAVQLRDSEAVRDRLMAMLDLVAVALEQKSYSDACRALVTELAMRMDCDRVSLGVVRGSSAEVIAVSHSAQFGTRMNLIDTIGAAMNEAIDQRSTVLYPDPSGNLVMVARDHERLSRTFASGAILTVPFSGSRGFGGALTFERPADRLFSDEDVDLAQSVAAVSAQVLEIRQANEKSLAARAAEAMRQQQEKLVGPGHVKAKLAAAIAVLLVLFFSFATGEYRVTAPATLEGAIRRSISAPYDGFIANSAVRAGDLVRSGAVLANLDDRDLRLENAKWTSQYAQYQNQYQEAVALHDRARAQISKAQYEQAMAQLTLLRDQMGRAVIRSPFDGVIVRGDLSQSLGSATKKGDVLFEITPLDSFRVIVQVDEGEIAQVAVGQRGNLLLGSIADEAFPFTVKNVTPVTTAREGRNYFRVEGVLDRAPERLRPGMEGVGKIDIEQRRLIWIWTHKLVNWMRLFVWTYLP